MCGVSLLDQRPSSELRQWVEVEPIGDVVRRNRLRWYGHMERKTDDDWVKGCVRFSVEGSVPPGRPKKTWKNTIANDMRLVGVREEDARDREKWKRAITRTRAHLAQTGQTPLNRR